MTILFEILTTPINLGDGIDGYDSVNYEYEVEEEDLKEAIVMACIDNFSFKERNFNSVYSFIEELYLWEELELKFEEDIKEYLFDICYDKADREYNENFR